MPTQTQDRSQRGALVTGGAGGIGAAISRALAEAGVRVAIHYHHNHDRAAALARDLRTADGEPALVQGDVAAAEDVLQQAASALGHVDMLINCAGGYVSRPLLDTSADELGELLRSDVVGTFRMIQQAAPAMIERGWGRIVNISSVAGQRYVEGEGAYGTAKAGVEMLTRAFAVELAPHGLTVNAIAPGVVQPTDDPVPAWPPQATGYGDVPTRRPGHASEVAALVRYLVSEPAGHVTGQIFNYDGGLTAQLSRPR